MEQEKLIFVVPEQSKDRGDELMELTLRYKRKEICRNELPRILRKEYSRVKNNNLRARKNGSAGTLTLRQWLYTLMLHNFCCKFCGTSEDITMEHITPLSMGGETSERNCVPACMKCNLALERHH